MRTTIYLFTALTVLLISGVAEKSIAQWSLSGNSISGTNFLGSTNNASLRFRTNNLQRLILDSLGNLGIGTITPTMKLDVLGDAKLNTGNTTDCDLVLQTTNTHMGWFAGGSSSKIALYNYGTATTLTTFLGDGKVGIGTTTPTSKLQIKSVGTTSSSSALSIQNSTSNPLLTVIDDGNVGIGTSSPSGKLHIQRASSGITPNNSYNLIVESNTNNYLHLLNPVNRQSTILFGANSKNGNISYNTSNNRGFRFFTNGSKVAMVIDSSQRVGIGVLSPTSKLSISGGNWDLSTTEGDFNIGNNTTRIKMSIATSGAGAGDARIWSQGGSNRLFLGGNNLNIVTIDALNEKVGINTLSPDYELDVCGTIRSKEIIVETGWCDFVFNKDYELRPLEEVKRFIEVNKHLPDVTPGSIVESKGLHVGDASSQMIRKIEELTLYMIQMNDKMIDKDLQISKLQAEIEALKIKK